MSTTWHNAMYLQHHHGLSQTDALKVRTLHRPPPVTPLDVSFFSTSFLLQPVPSHTFSLWFSSFSPWSQFVELARMDGVRRMNVLKNVLRPLYAFNALQRMALPDAFRPLEFCCGKVQS